MNNKIQKIKDILAQNQAALITSDSNRFYLSGFSSSAGVIYISKTTAAFFVDFRYYENAKKQVTDLDVVLLSNTFEQINSLLKNESILELLLETSEVTYYEFTCYADKLNAKISTSNILSETISDLRAIKSAYEIEQIKKAQSIAEKAFEHILETIKIGRTEREIMLDLEFFMRKLGSDGVAFDSIVVSGKNSSLPHGDPTDKKIEAGDFVTMDFGARFNGYCSDMTRTVAVKGVSDEQKEIYNLVLSAQNAAFDVIKPGAVCKEVDFTARSMIYNAGYEGAFGHGLGHSLGIDVHENPAFNTRCEVLLKSGMVMTVEPGIYLENKFGVRIEDMVLITDEGFTNLTNSPKGLIIV